MVQSLTGWRNDWKAVGIAYRHMLLVVLVASCGLGALWPNIGLADPIIEIGTGPTPSSNRIAVVYPDIGEPYGSVFVSITKGIESELDISPQVFTINTRNLDPIRAQLASGKFGACIALGRTTLEQLEALPLDIPLVRGAVLDLNVPKTGGDAPVGISLTPDPTFLLKQLKRLAPGVSRVTVVYSDSQGQALIDRAMAVGQRLNLTVIAHQAEDLLSAAAMYKSVASNLGPRDALWIPQDPHAVDDKVILPMLLNAAWEQYFVLFSSNADHAKRGALFSVYPDNFAMGAKLARIAAQRIVGTSANAGMQPLDDLLIAVNLRTAEHLRINLGPHQIRSFDLTFPQR